MGKISTYSLNNGNENSDKYYKDISKFADKIIVEMENHIGVEVAYFKGFIKENNIEALRSDLEYSLELLIIGILWRTYINKAIRLRKIPQSVMIKLTKLRGNHNIKKPVDFTRGVLGTLFLDKEKNIKVKINLENFIKLLDWLEATGEFKHEVKRLRLWEKYFYNKSEKNIREILEKVLVLEENFELESNRYLQEYTKHLEKFHREVYKEYKWKEDYIFCGRKRVEYHMNMVGAEILNRAYREDYLKTQKRLVLLPACMRLNPKICKAVKTSMGYACARCSEGCKINKYSKLGERENFKVYIIHHQSEALKKKDIKEGTIGIIGVTCVLNLIEGGLNAKELGFVPQCVLLDYCGCKEHWNKDGFVTDINEKKFLEIEGYKKWFYDNIKC